VLAELGHHLARLESRAVGEHALDQQRGAVQERKIAFDCWQNIGSENLDGDFGPGMLPGWEPREMHLCHRSAGNRLRIETCVHLAERPAERALDFGRGKFVRKRRHLVLELRQFIGDVRRQQVAPCREHLAELDEYRAQRLQRVAQPHGARIGEIAKEQHRIDQASGTPARGERELVQAEAERDPQDLDEANEAQHARMRSAG